MLHPFMSIGTDETEVLCSDSYEDAGMLCFDVHIETVTVDDFEGLIIQLPTGVVKKSWGLSDVKQQYWVDFAKRNYKSMLKYVLHMPGA